MNKLEKKLALIEKAHKKIKAKKYNKSEYLSSDELAGLLSVPKYYISHWRGNRDAGLEDQMLAGPPYEIIGKITLYRVDDVDEWLDNVYLPQM